MAWSKTGGAGASDGGSSTETSFAISPGVAVVANDVIWVAVTFGKIGAGVNGAVLADQLGNIYNPLTAILNTPNSQGLQLFYCVVTANGTPVITAQFNPTPGTTNSDSVSIVAEFFRGGHANSTLDGQSANDQATPTTSANALVSGTCATTKDGNLLFAATVDTATGNSPGTAGTGWTAGDLTTFVILITEWQVQATHSASTQATFTAAANDDHLTAIGCISIGSAPVDDGSAFRLRRRRH